MDGLGGIELEAVIPNGAGGGAARLEVTLSGRNVKTRLFGGLLKRFSPPQFLFQGLGCL